MLDAHGDTLVTTFVMEPYQHEALGGLSDADGTRRHHTTCRLIGCLRDRVAQAKISGRIFGVTGNAIHLAWDRIVGWAGIADLHFRDLRHEAISRFFELGLTLPEVAMISGHRVATMLFRCAHANSEAVFNKLNAKLSSSYERAARTRRRRMLTGTSASRGGGYPI